MGGTSSVVLVPCATGPAINDWYFSISIHHVIYIYRCIYICFSFIHIHTHTHLSVRPSLPPSLPPSIHPCMHPCIYPSIHACMHTCIHTYRYICIYIHIYIYTERERHILPYQYIQKYMYGMPWLKPVKQPVIESCKF